MRDEPADDAARRIPEVRIQPEKVHASTVQRRTDHEHTQQEPPKGHAAGNYIPTHAPLAVAVALDEQYTSEIHASSRPMLSLHMSTRMNDTQKTPGLR